MRMTIQIQNDTHWATRDLRRFVTRLSNEILDDNYRVTHPVIRVRFGHHTPKHYREGAEGYSSGHAYVHGSFAHISVPKIGVDKIDLAHTIAHEFGHLRGMRHRDMTGGALWYRIGNWREIYAWADALPLGKKTVRAKATADERRKAKFLSMEARLRIWESKERRAKNAIKKLRRKLAQTKRAMA